MSDPALDVGDDEATASAASPQQQQQPQQPARTSSTNSVVESLRQQLTKVRAALEDANRAADTLRAEKAALEAENAQQRSRIIELELSTASPTHSGSGGSSSKRRPKAAAHARAGSADSIELADGDGTSAATRSRKHADGNLLAVDNGGALSDQGGLSGAEDDLDEETATSLSATTSSSQRTNSRTLANAHAVVVEDPHHARLGAHRHDNIDVNAHISASNGASAETTPEDDGLQPQPQQQQQGTSEAKPQKQKRRKSSSAAHRRPGDAAAASGARKNSSPHVMIVLNLDEATVPSIARNNSQPRFGTAAAAGGAGNSAGGGSGTFLHPSDAHRHDNVDVNAHSSASNGGSAESTPQRSPHNGPVDADPAANIGAVDDDAELELLVLGQRAKRDAANGESAATAVSALVAAGEDEELSDSRVHNATFAGAATGSVVLRTSPSVAMAPPDRAATAVGTTSPQQHHSDAQAAATATTATNTGATAVEGGHSPHDDGDDQRRQRSPKMGMGMDAMALSGFEGGYASDYASTSYTNNYDTDYGASSGAISPLASASALQRAAATASMAAAAAAAALLPLSTDLSGVAVAAPMTGSFGVRSVGSPQIAPGTTSGSFTCTSTAGSPTGLRSASGVSPSCSSLALPPQQSPQGRALRGVTHAPGVSAAVAAGLLMHTESISTISLADIQSTGSFVPLEAAARKTAVQAAERVAAVASAATSATAAAASTAPAMELAHAKTQTAVRRTANVAVTASLTDIVETMRRCHGVDVSPASPARSLRASAATAAAAASPSIDATSTRLADVDAGDSEAVDAGAAGAAASSSPAADASPVTEARQRVYKLATAELAQMHLDRLQGLLDHVNHVAVATRCVESVSPRRG